MVAQGESSQPSVNERLARAREEDLRRCRNLQAKLVRRRGSAESYPRPQAPSLAQPTQAFASSSSSRAGLMFLASTAQAERERDQRSRERQLKRQVAGPIPPESWRDDFDRLSIRRGVTLPSNSQPFQSIRPSNTASNNAEGPDSAQTNQNSIAASVMTSTKEIRDRHRAACAGLRRFHDSLASATEGASIQSLRDMALCVIADELNCPPMPAGSSKGKARQGDFELDQTLRAELLEYLPTHFRHRILSLFGRLAATRQPLSDSVAQALISADAADAASQQEGLISNEDVDDDWETSALDYMDFGTAASITSNDAASSLDLSFSSISKHTMARMLFTMQGGQMCMSLRMLSLAGWNSTEDSRSNGTHLEELMSILDRLPNLEVLCLAGSRLSATKPPDAHHSGGATVLRKLSRSLPKLKTLDLSYCAWAQADTILSVDWATSLFIAWPHLENLVLVACLLSDGPSDKLLEAARSGTFIGEAAGNFIAPWHAKYSRDKQRSNATGQMGTVRTPPAANTHTTLHEQWNQRDRPVLTYGLFGDSYEQGLWDYINRQTPLRADHGGSDGVIRSPHTRRTVKIAEFQRARVLEAVRGRAKPGARERKWVEVWF